LIQKEKRLWTREGMERGGKEKGKEKRKINPHQQVVPSNFRTVAASMAISRIQTAV